jgi:uncharacterized repeat protein (TIGR02543 family)
MQVSPEGAGSVSVKEDGAISARTYTSVTQAFLPGATAEFTATPADGYVFIGWEGGLSGADNPSSIQMNACATITALFAPGSVVTVVASGDGTITPDVGRHTYGLGSVVNLAATPLKGWQFDSWSGNVNDPASAATTLVVDADKIVTANFSRIMHTLTVNSTHGGKDPEIMAVYQYEEGTTVNVTAAVEKGWRFNGWNGEQADITSETVSVTMDADKTVTADFTRTMPEAGQIGIIAGVVASGLAAFYIPKRKRRPTGSDATASVVPPTE